MTRRLHIVNDYPAVKLVAVENIPVKETITEVDWLGVAERLARADAEAKGLIPPKDAA